METINVSEAKSRFSEFLSRAASGERFVIVRRARPLLALIGAAELGRPERSAIVAALPLVHTPIDDLDLQIASIALEHDLPLATNNTKHFKRVNDLQLENWIG